MYSVFLPERDGPSILIDIRTPLFIKLHVPVPVYITSISSRGLLCLLAAPASFLTTGFRVIEACAAGMRVSAAPCHGRYTAPCLGAWDVSPESPLV